MQSGLDLIMLFALQASMNPNSGICISVLIFAFSALFQQTAQAQVVESSSKGLYSWKHVVRKGESLHGLCQDFGISLIDLKNWNQLRINSVAEGDTINIPISPFDKMVDGACTAVQFYKCRINQTLPQISQITQIPILDIKKTNQRLGRSVEDQEYLMLPYIAPPQSLEKSENRRIAGIVSLGQFAANAWDGSKKLNYSINLRGSLRYAWEYDRWRNVLNVNTALGVRHELGRDMNKNLDQFDFLNQIQYRLQGSTSAFAIYAMQSQFFRTYFVRSNGDRVLISNFMSPAYTNFAVGLQFEGNSFNVEVGLYELKTTYVLDQHLYVDEFDEVYGVPYGANKFLEHGMSLRVNVYYYGGEKLIINGNMTMFSNTETIDFYLRNDLTYRISKKLRLSMLSQIQYDVDAAAHAIYRNEIQLGYSFIFR